MSAKVLRSYRRERTARAGRNALIAWHLTRIEAQLDETRSPVASLRGLLRPPETPIRIEHRSVEAMPAFVIRETIDLDVLGNLFTRAVGARDRVAETSGLRVASPVGCLWLNDLFPHEHGEAAPFCPSSRPAACVLPVLDVARLVVAQGSFGLLMGVLWWKYRNLTAIVVAHVIMNGWPVAAELMS